MTATEDKLPTKQIHASFESVGQRFRPELGETGYGLFMCINQIEPRSESVRANKWSGALYEQDTRYASQVTKVRAVWADFDDPTMPLPEFDLEPSFIVQSSPGKHHVYWLVDPADPLPVAEFDMVQSSIINAYSLNAADKSMKSPSHIMRLPGSLHRKDEPRLVTLKDVTGLRLRGIDAACGVPSTLSLRPKTGTCPRTSTRPFNTS